MSYMLLHAPAGSPADDSGLEIGDKLVHVNAQNVQQLSHNGLVSAIKKV